MDSPVRYYLNHRPQIFQELPNRSDLELYFDIVKRDETIYFVAVEDKNIKGCLFVGTDSTLRFFLNVDCADQYREYAQRAAPQYNFFIVRFQAVNGIARAISDSKTSSRPTYVAVSTFKKEILVDIDLVYSQKQLLN